MPRRRKRVLDHIETGIAFKPEFRESAAECINKLPPGVYRLLAQSPEQLAKWELEKIYFMRVGQVLDTYFSGEAPPNFDELTNQERNAIELCVWRYLSFYSMIFTSWKSVRKVLARERCPPIPILAGYESEVTRCDKSTASATTRIAIAGCKFSTLDSPGKVLLKVIEYSAIRQMDFYFGKLSKQKDKSPYARRKFIIDVQRSRDAEASKLLIDRIEAELREQLSLDPASWLEQVCFFACYDNQKTDQAKQAVETYLKAGKAQEDFEKKELHPQTKNRRGMAMA